VVLTAKHHDGFALWPTRWGNFSTRQYCGGRDLLRPYVDGLRAAGLKVGFYFSPQGWHYPGFPLGDVDFDHKQRNRRPPIADPAANADAAAILISSTPEGTEIGGRLAVKLESGLITDAIDSCDTSTTRDAPCLAAMSSR